MIRYKCSKCLAQLDSPNSLAGQQEKCPNCGVQVTIPAVAKSPPQSIPTRNQSPSTKVPRWWLFLVGGLAAALFLTAGSVIGLVLAGSNARDTGPHLSPAASNAPTATQLEETRTLAQEAIRRASAAEEELRSLKQQIRTGGTSAPSKVIRAERLELVDEKGRKRIELSGVPTRLANPCPGEKEGAVGLILYGEKGQRAATIGAGDDGGSHLAMYDGDGGDGNSAVRITCGLMGGKVGNTVTSMTVGGEAGFGVLRLLGHTLLTIGRTDDGNQPAIALGTDPIGPHLTLMKGKDSASLANFGNLGMALAFTKQEKTAVAIGVALEGNNYLSLADEDGKLRAKLVAGKDGPVLGLWDEKGNPRATLVAIKDGTALSLHDDKGNPRAQLNVAEDGPGLILGDDKGKPRVKLDAGKDGSSLSLYDEKGKGGTMLAAGKDGPTLSLHDANDKLRAALVADKDGTTLALTDENGKLRAKLAAFKGGPALNLYDDNEKLRAALSATKDGPWLFMFDENGKLRATLAAFKGGPALSLFDENDKSRAKLAAFKDGPWLSLFDENGKSIWAAPR